MSPAQLLLGKIIELLKRLIQGPVPEYVPVRSKRSR